MQIFILDNNIRLNAIYYCDKHVVKIITELCQIMSTVYRKHSSNLLMPDFIFKSTHEKHPCVLWCGKNISNFCYCIELSEALYNEYQYRYNKPEKHTRAKQIIDYFKMIIPALPCEPLSLFAQAIPEQYKSDNAVESYREYYRKEKSHLFKWTKRPIPEWINSNELLAR